MIYLIDLFCGAGGTSTGVEQAQLNNKKIAKVVACVNHDAKAIASHLANHPDVIHYTEDIRTLNLNKLIQLVTQIRMQNPDAVIIVWASMECTNFSKAKGGLPRDADSRTLALDMYRYLEALNPDYFMYENVEEFMSWGPLDEKGKPVSREQGVDFVKWCNHIQNMGYSYEHRKINSADFGAYTSRRRLFGIFAAPGFPISWPEATHAKNPQKEGMFGKLEKWKAVREVLDLDDHGKSIFNRKKELSVKTLSRIYAGLIKYVAGGKKQFISKQFSGHDASKNISLENPAGTITTIPQQALVTAHFMTNYHGKVEDDKSIDKCHNTVTTKDDCNLVTVQFLDQQYGNSTPGSINEVGKTITNNPKFALVTAPFIMDTQFNNTVKSINEPASTITANRKHHYLVNPQWGNGGSSIDVPCCTIIARQDKMPLYLIEVTEGQYNIPVYEGDSEMMIKIKQFMAMYGIADILMRMLKVLELLKIQGFPWNYILLGNQADQKKFIGNSVAPLVPKRQIEALAHSIFKIRKLEVA